MVTTPIPASLDANASHAFASTLQNFQTACGKPGKFYSLPALAEQFPKIKRLPQIAPHFLNGLCIRVCCAM